VFQVALHLPSVRGVHRPVANHASLLSNSVSLDLGKAVWRARARFRYRVNGFYTKRVSIPKTSGNEGYYTNSLILLIMMMLCSKLPCQKFFKMKLFSYEIGQPE